MSANARYACVLFSCMWMSHLAMHRGWLEQSRAAPRAAALWMLQAYRKAVSFLEQQEADFKSGGQGGMWKGKKARSTK